MRYKGYTGRFTVDLDEDVIRGRVVGIRDMVTFQGATITEARAEFTRSVDEYLDFCQKLGRPPETPYSGRLRITLPPRQHRRLALMAEQTGSDLNEVIRTLLATNSKAFLKAASRPRKPKKPLTRKKARPTEPRS